EIRVVVEELELQTRGPADDLADGLEARFVLAGHLDDDVFVPGGHRGLAQTELVDAAQDDVSGLAHRPLADLALRLLPNGELEGAIVHDARLHVRLEQVAEAR